MEIIERIRNNGVYRMFKTIVLVFSATWLIFLIDREAIELGVKTTLATKAMGIIYVSVLMIESINIMFEKKR